jgi:hypothetical protein|tara:strand:+ start:303 stop:539 length:237 start_codon:yes stop_codon:yes gene_type:complete
MKWKKTKHKLIVGSEILRQITDKEDDGKVFDNQLKAYMYAVGKYGSAVADGWGCDKKYLIQIVEIKSLDKNKIPKINK